MKTNKQKSFRILVSESHGCLVLSDGDGLYLPGFFY